MNQTLRWTLGALLASLLVAPAASAWIGERESPHHARLAREAALLLPPPMRDAILAEENALARGANEPDTSVDPYFHRFDPSDPEWGGAVGAADDAYAKAVDALRAGKAREAAYWLGSMSHFILDVAQPMHSGGDEAIGHRHHAEYEEAAFERAGELDVAVTAPVVDRPGELAGWWSAQRGAARWPALEAALDRADGPWSDEVARVTEDALADGLLAAAGAMSSAFAEAGWRAPTPAAHHAPQTEPAPAAPQTDVAPGPSENSATPRLTAVLLGGVLLVAGALAWRSSKRVPQRTRAGGDELSP